MRCALIVQTLIRYTGDCVVALATLGWDETKQAKLELSAYRLYEAQRKSGQYFARIRSLLESELLPELSNGLFWTFSMTGELIRLNGKFKLLGNAKNAYVPIPNDDGILSLEDLIFILLKNSNRSVGSSPYALG